MKNNRSFRNWTPLDTATRNFLPAHQPPPAPFGHPLPLGGGEGWGEGVARRFKGARRDQSSRRSLPVSNEPSSPQPSPPLREEREEREKTSPVYVVVVPGCALRNWRRIAGLAFVAFVGQNASLQPANAQSVARDALLRDVVRNVIASDYQELAGKCRALTASAEQLVQVPAPESLEKIRQAWVAAVLASRRVQWLQTGPIADREYLSTFYYSKLLPVRIEGVLNSPRPIDDAYIAELGAAAKGLFTLEYLLFEPRAESPAKDAKNSSPDSKTFFGTNVQRRCQFVLALAGDVQKKAEKVAQDWAGATPGDPAARFVEGGQQTLNTLVNQMAKIVEDLAENHLNFVLQLPAPIMRQLDRIEGARSRTSLSQLAAILRGVHQLYRGGEGLGIDDSLRELNRAVEARVEQQFQKALSALEAIELPLEEAVTDRKESVQRAYQAVHDLEILFKTDLASALGVTITISSNDGD